MEAGVKWEWRKRRCCAGVVKMKTRVNRMSEAHLDLCWWNAIKRRFWGQSEEQCFLGVTWGTVRVWTLTPRRAMWVLWGEGQEADWNIINVLVCFCSCSRQVQCLRDPEGAECQEYDHHGAGRPAVLGAGLHVVRLETFHLLICFGTKSAELA